MACAEFTDPTAASRRWARWRKRDGGSAMRDTPAQLGSLDQRLRLALAAQQCPRAGSSPWRTGHQAATHSPKHATAHRRVTSWPAGRPRRSPAAAPRPGAAATAARRPPCCSCGQDRPRLVQLAGADRHHVRGPGCASGAPPAASGSSLQGELSRVGCAELALSSQQQPEGGHAGSGGSLLVGAQRLRGASTAPGRSFNASFASASRSCASATNPGLAVGRQCGELVHRLGVAPAGRASSAVAKRSASAARRLLLPDGPRRPCPPSPSTSSTAMPRTTAADARPAAV